MLSPIAWRTPPRKYGPWESIVSTLTEGLTQRGIEVTLFATADSLTGATLHSVCDKGYEEKKMSTELINELKSFKNLWKGGYFEGDPLNPLSKSSEISMHKTFSFFCGKDSSR